MIMSCINFDSLNTIDRELIIEVGPNHRTYESFLFFLLARMVKIILSMLCFKLFINIYIFYFKKHYQIISSID